MNSCATVRVPDAAISQRPMLDVNQVGEVFVEEWDDNQRSSGSHDDDEAEKEKEQGEADGNHTAMTESMAENQQEGHHV